MDDVKRYDIGGTVYEQRMPVLGQLMELARLFTSVDMATVRDEAAFASALGQALPRFLAIVLVPEGTRAHRRDMDARAETMAENCTGTTARDVVRDFFDWPGVLEEMSAMGSARTALGTMLAAAAKGRESAGTSWPDTSSAGPCSSPEETSPDASASCGACGPTR
ncbi:hypothetical protein GGQ74_000077 [Desulfobaculum xiamenense]|uniref:Uncharacterized protein n=1 Tax=Desulfobaculum xiamenense TaxID=995050 RepID=A0A846QHF2_9BACT|nr:hypothetical protein [Desulfobaculum xiamenense]NJB66437.1 hypothetical protein [Desulfobaculum xiamenense]